MRGRDVPEQPTNGFLTREAVQQAEDILTEEVQVPEWGGKLLVKTMSGTERDAFENEMTEIKGTGRNATIKQDLTNFRTRIVIATACGPDLVPLFTKEDVTWLAKKSGAGLTRVAEVAIRLNRLSREDIEELAGNSSGDQSADSGSA